jgi:hypothetical protein
VSRRRKPPLFKTGSATAHAAQLSQIEILSDLRCAFGKSTFYDHNTHKERYPLETVGAALRLAVEKAGRIGEQIELSTEEAKLWKSMFPQSSDSKFKPDVSRQTSF